MAQLKHSLHRPSRVVTPVGLRLEKWQRRALYGAISVLVATGLVWLLAHFVMHAASSFGDSVSPAEPIAMKLHGAGAMAAFFLVGSILNGHIRRALRGHRNHVSGWIMVTLMAFLSLTGYGLYYLVGESNHALWSALHWVPGCLLAFVLIAHVWLGRRTRG